MNPDSGVPDGADIPNDTVEEPLPPFREQLAKLRPDEHGQGAPGAVEVPNYNPTGETRMFFHPRIWQKGRQYWDPAVGYVGYWEDLEVPKTLWKNLTRGGVIFALALGSFLTFGFFGFWWLTLVIVEGVVGPIVVLGTPPGPVIWGQTYFRRRVILPIVLFCCVMGFASLEAYDSYFFGTSSLSGPPPQVLTCGQLYLEGGASIAVPRHIPLHRVGVTPSGYEILGNKHCNSAGSIWVFLSTPGGRLLPYNSGAGPPGRQRPEPYDK